MRTPAGSITYHILNGDMLADQLKETNIQGEFIVCAECLVDGDVTGDTLAQFWTTRAKYIAGTYHTTTNHYYTKCVREFEKIRSLPERSEICFWFENDLFCQTNMWFVLSLLHSRQTRNQIFRVFPIINNKADLWKGFGISNGHLLEQAYAAKFPFISDDIQLGKNLWNAYKTADFARLAELSKQPSLCFQHLEEVCQAHIDRFPTDNSLGRPDKTVKAILETKSQDFQVVYSEFSDQQGVYGFGDSQLKTIFERQLRTK